MTSDAYKALSLSARQEARPIEAVHKASLPSPLPCYSTASPYHNQDSPVYPLPSFQSD